MGEKRVKKKILIVDDDQAILDSLQIMLEMEGYKVISLENADKIYKIIRLHKPSLILLDIWLPGGIDGVELTKYLKTDKELKHIPVILISAISNIQKIGKNSCADDFLAKPFEIDEVIEKVERYT